MLAFSGGLLAWSSLDSAYASSAGMPVGGVVAARSAPTPTAVSAKSDRGDYIVEILPSASDRAQWSLARQSLARFDAGVLGSLTGADLSGSDAATLKRFSAAYDALRSTVDYGQSAPTRFLLTSVSAALLDSFEQGNLPQSALFGSAASVETIDAGRVLPVGIPMRTMTRSATDPGVILAQIQELQDAAAGLDSLDRSYVSGTIDQSAFGGITDQQLRDLLPGSPLADQIQGELDRRLSQSLPDLSPYANGQLPDNLLCPIPWATGHSVLCVALDNFIRLDDAYRAQFGTDLPILDGYRPLSAQEYVHENDPTMTAVPGTSNHGWGLAVDFDWDVFADWSDPQVEWMIENGPRFGWRHPAALGPSTDRPEPWHFEFGTVYSNNDSADFDGPTPVVIYRFTFPAAQ